MKKIINPFINKDGYNCFGCSPTNEHGLQMEFYEDNEFLISKWKPKAYLTGYGTVLHGGVQSLIFDEIASWLVYVKAKTAGVTATLNVKYKSPVFTDKGNLLIKAKLIDHNRRFATIHAEMIDAEGKLCSTAEVKYFLFPLEIAKSRFHYPGVDAFFE